MQIEIACTGGYKIENFLDELDNLYGCIDNTIEGLSNVCCEITRVNGGMNSTLDEAYTNINCRIVQEKNKQDSVRTIRERAQLFYDTTLQIDEQVACQVDENSEKFFAEYSGMGTVSSIEESWWDKFVDGWNDIWDTVEDAMETAIDGICDFFTEHAVEVIVGSIGFIVGGALMIYLGGVTLATVAMTALLALGAVALEAGIMALIEYLRGGNFWEAFQEYFASGFMFAGIFFALQAIFSAVVNIIKARKAEKARKAAEVAKKVDDVAAGGNKIIGNAIPNVEKATIAPEKLTEYALNPAHPVGGNKAKVFERALGYNQSNADDLMHQIYEKLPSSEAILGKLDEYGQRYTVDMLIKGPNGNTVNVRTGWIIKKGSDIPELTTIFVKD